MGANGRHAGQGHIAFWLQTTIATRADDLFQILIEILSCDTGG